MNTNICFLWNTTGIDKAAFSANGSVEGWPVANLQHPQPAKAWKCPTGKGEITILCDDTEMITAVAIIGHNLGVDSTLTIRGYEDDLATEVYSETFEVIQPVYTPAELLPCNSSPLGYPSDDDLAVLPRTTAVFFLKEALCQYKYKIEIDNGDKPFHVGRLIMSDHFEPDHNISPGWRETPVDTSNIGYSLGGQLYADDRKRRYSFSFALNYLSEGEIYGALRKLLYHCGISRPLVVSLIPDDPLLRQQTSLYCTLKSSVSVVHNSKNQSSANFIVEEYL
ncbi:hypothetical protein [Maridesulfovibrio ferrireducens]|uniref:hypothetical protein n=1 Tax=Maridesulfovibrio ferrireducens TaxID=246191 RepID=UPI001A297AEE|nr:hypothetical protein [Maridesulfovibrio ferrireducens]MBI9110302.1 hypothetical protein [Maridesulfovibrio ferrireducens]